MCKKVLMIACVPSMIGQFNMDNIKILQEEGYEVDVACDFTDRSVWNEWRVCEFQNDIHKQGIRTFQIDFSRSATNFKRHLTSYKQLIDLLRIKKYKFIHCHTPIAGAIVRLACERMSVKCIYTAHGFHFYKGAPIQNWLIFYPIEKWLSRYTDVLITINKEDYNRSKKNFKARKIKYIPGAGIDIKKFHIEDFDRERYREKLGLREKDYMVLSVGELNDNKNHSTIIRAIAKLENKNIYYFIAGSGCKKHELLSLIEMSNLEDRVNLLGFRTDIPELCNSADLFAFPSKREGLGIAAIEAMAAGLPLITSNIHGIKDYSIDMKSGLTFEPCDVNGFSKGIDSFFKGNQDITYIRNHNSKKANKFSELNVNNIMKKIYSEIDLYERGKK